MHKIILKILPVFTFLILFSECSERKSRSFYLSQDGNDSSSGTFKKPWKSVERINSEILQPGDKIFFRGGETFKGTLIIDSIDVTGGNKLIISSYGIDRAVINGGASAGIHFINAHDFVVSNLLIEGDGRKSGNSSDGFIISYCDNFFIDSIEIYGFQHSGLKVSDCKNAVIQNVIAHDNGFAGIHVTSEIANHPTDYGNEHITISYCRAYNNPGDPTVVKNHSGNGILVSSVKGGTIEYCEAYNNGWDMLWTGNGPVGIWIWDCTDFLIQYCVSHHNKTNPFAKDGGGFDLDGGVSQSVIQYCISYCNQGAGYGLFEFGASKPWENNILRYNLSYNDGLLNDGSVAIWKDKNAELMRNCEIYNNTFYNDTLRGISFSAITNCNGIVFTNNIFVFRKNFLDTGQSIVDEKFITNCFYGLQENFLIPDEIKDNNIVSAPLFKHRPLIQTVKDPVKDFKSITCAF
ncbi:MAG: right-handed parallel beta-helix repeat-containing protein, partial [Bacteroidales bacterium]